MPNRTEIDTAASNADLKALMQRSASGLEGLSDTLRDLVSAIGMIPVPADILQEVRRSLDALSAATYVFDDTARVYRNGGGSELEDAEARHIRSGDSVDSAMLTLGLLGAASCTPTPK